MIRLLAVLFLLSPLAATAQSTEKYSAAIQSLEKQFERERQDAEITGLAIAVVEDQTVLWARGFGHADLARTRGATPETVFRVGSVSKLFTDIAVMQLVEEGKIDLDAPVTRYLSEFKPANPFKTAVTLRHLMSHRSGLIREPPTGNYFDPAPTSLAKTVESVNDIPLVYEPGKRIKYSNAAIAAVGLAVEKVDGRPFHQAVRERVLKPLGMTSSDFERTAVITERLSEAGMWTYHGREFPAPTFELGESPAGCMYSTVTDLARFMSAVFAGGRGPGGRVLRPASLQSMLTPQFDKSDAREGFGLGFMLGKLDDHRRVGHGGAIYGFSTELAFLPDSKLGVVVVANRDVTNRVTTRLADSALRHFLAARAGKPFPPDRDSQHVPRTQARKLAGKYGEKSEHELMEAGGKLFHLPAAGGFVSEVRIVGDEFVLGGPLGNGMRFRCDGATLTTVDPKQGFVRRPAADEVPPEPKAHFRGLIGEYGWDHNVLYIFEKDARLHALIEWFFLYPLTEESKDVFQFPPDTGLYHGEKLVFRRDASGRATEVEAAHVRFKRRTLDGEDGKTFRIQPVRPVDELRKEAASALPPIEKGEFRKADLVELTGLDSTIKTDLRYATANNFMGTALYPKSARAYMQRPAANALVRVNQALAKKGYGLWIFDSYRPWAVTRMFWDATPEKLRTFVADPAKGSRHNRGCAVDLTLYDLKTGLPVETVSGFDEFSDRAYPNYWGGSSRQRWHRELLRRAMEDEGFSVYEAEWWHFDFEEWKHYPIGNQTFEQLKR